MALDTRISVYLSADHPWTASPTWTNVTAGVLSVNINRSGNPVTGFTGATCQIELNDSTGTYDNDLFGGTWYLESAWTHVLVQAAGSGTPTTMFRGYTSPSRGWVRIPGEGSAVMALSCVDLVSLISVYPVDLSSIAAEWSADRVQRVLDAVAAAAGLGSWPGGFGSAPTARSTVFVDAVDDEAVNAWQHIQACARGEHGMAFVTAAGAVDFWGRHYAANNYATTPTVIVTDDGNASHLPLLTGSLRVSSTTEYPRAVVTTAGGYTATADDVESNEVPLTWTSAGLPISDYAADELANLIVQGRSGFDPVPASASVVLASTGANNTTAALHNTAAAIDIGTQVRVEATPIGQASQQVWDVAVTAVSHTITAEAWGMSLQFEPEEWWTGGIGPTELLRWDVGTWDNFKWGY